MKVEELAAVVDDKELEKLIAHVERVTVHFLEENEMFVIRSSLSGLHLRIKKLRCEDLDG